MLEIEAATSTTYHPQTDGAEFSYNNHVHFSTQQTPFLLDTGRHLQMGFKLHQPPSHIEAVNEFTDQMKDTLEEAKSALAKAKDDIARYYNFHHSPAPTFSPSNLILRISR